MANIKYKDSNGTWQDLIIGSTNSNSVNYPTIDISSLEDNTFDHLFSVINDSGCIHDFNGGSQFIYNSIPIKFKIPGLNTIHNAQITYMHFSTSVIEINMVDTDMVRWRLVSNTEIDDVIIRCDKNAKVIVDFSDVNSNQNVLNNKLVMPVYYNTGNTAVLFPDLDYSIKIWRKDINSYLNVTKIFYSELENRSESYYTFNTSDANIKLYINGNIEWITISIPTSTEE